MSDLNDTINTMMGNGADGAVANIRPVIDMSPTDRLALVLGKIRDMDFQIETDDGEYIELRNTAEFAELEDILGQLAEAPVSDTLFQRVYAEAEHVFHHDDTIPRINLKVEKNSRGFNYEATVTSHLDVQSALAMLQDAQQKLETLYGTPATA